MESVLQLILSVILAFQAGITSLWQKKPPALPSETDITSAVCLTEKQAEKGIEPGNVRVPKILRQIKKPNSVNTASGYEIEQCQNQGSCIGPEIADYRLVATNVRLSHIVYPNAFEPELKISDRQLVKQHDFTDNPILQDRYKNRIYRTFCGDWCYTCPPGHVSCDNEGLHCSCDTYEAVSLPYRGSFYCDFVFYLQDEDEKGNAQLDEYGDLPPERQNPNDNTLPQDMSLFSVYFRIGATLPENIRCSSEKKPDTQSWLRKFLSLFSLPKVYSQEKTGGVTIVYPPGSSNHYLFEANPRNQKGAYRARNTQITTEVMQKLKEKVKVDFLKKFSKDGEGVFEVYQNLLDPYNNDYLYFVEPGKIEEMLSALANPKNLQVKIFAYYLFSRINTTTGSQKTIKLGRFKPIVAKNWVSKWAEESKPAIYFYPPAKVDLTVRLFTRGEITVSDPPYNPEHGWWITAYPSGFLQLTSEVPFSKFYPYLFYEANLEEVKVESKGWIISQNQLAVFLRSKLKELGLNQKEIKDFLEYWLPKLSQVGASYFFVHFLDNRQIEDLEPMEISLVPETVIRLRAYFKPVDFPFSLPPQKFSLAKERKGFTVVEWGGILDLD